MSTNMAEVNQYAMVEKVVVQGDLSALSPQERLAYYRQVCDSVGLNPLTRPFEYIKLNNKLVLYAKRDATDQLRKIHGVSVTIAAREKVDDLYAVTAQAKDKDGRTDESIGAVNLKGLTGDYAANAMMKAETKAKRRVTLSICGLGMLDETEIASVPDAVHVPVTDAGEILDQKQELKPMEESAVADHLAALESAADILSLQKAFSTAIDVCAKAKDMAARDKFVAAKDKRKLEIQPK